MLLRLRFYLRTSNLFMFLTVCLWMSASSGFSEEPLVLHPDQDGVQRATIAMESYVYSPRDLVVESGKPVELTLQNNSFLVPHNFLLDSPEGKRLMESDIESGEIETIQFTLTTPGTYSFYCDKQLLFFPKHREEGMEGTILAR